MWNIAVTSLDTVAPVALLVDVCPSATLQDSSAVPYTNIDVVICGYLGWSVPVMNREGYKVSPLEAIRLRFEVIYSFGAHFN